MPDVVEQIQREAASAEARTREEHRVARGELRASAGQAKEEVSEESRVAKVKAYQPFEEPLQALKREIAFETRRGYLPGYKSDPDPLRAQRESLKARREIPLREADIWRREAFGTVETELARKEGELDQSLRISLEEIRQWKEQTLSEYQVVEEQPQVVEEQPRAQVVSNQAEIDEFERTHVNIGKDKWALRSDWNKLTNAQKVEVKATGSYTVPGVTISGEGYEVAGGTSPGVTIHYEDRPVIMGDTEFDRLTRELGREPTLGEMEAYARGKTPSYGGHFGTLTSFPIVGPMAHQFRLGAELLIPGTQSRVEESFWKTLPQVVTARKGWYEGTFKWGVPPTPLQVGYEFFPASRVFSSKVSFGEITGSEWAQTGVSAALLAAPLWMPPIVRGVKATPQIPASFRARLGTYPFSEPVGLMERPGLKIGPGTRIPGRVRVPEAYEQAFRVSKPYEAIPGRAPHTTYTPTKVESLMSSKEIAALYGRGVKAYEPIPGRAPHTTYTPLKIEGVMSSEEIASLYGRQIAGGWSTAKPKIVTPSPQWVQTPMGRYVPANLKPLYVTDVPFTMPLQFPSTVPSYQKVAQPSAQVMSYTLIGVGVHPAPTPLHLPLMSMPRVQAVPYPVTRGVAQPKTITDLVTKPVTELAVQTQVKPVTGLGIKTQVEPATGISTLSQVKTLTDIQTLLRIKPVTRTVVSVKGKTATGIDLFLGRGVAGGKVTPPTRKWPRPKFPLPDEAVKKGPGKPKKWPAGTITWRQGFVRKYIAPPYKAVKPTSVYEGTGSGVPKDTIKIIGGPAPITAQIDLGVVDVFVEGKSQRIRFVPGGLKTDVGRRHPSKTKGMSVTRSAGFKKVRV